MQYKFLTALFLATTALAVPTADSTPTESNSEITSSDYDNYDDFDYDDAYYGDYGDYGADLLGDIPPSIIAVMATAIPASWYSDILDPASRDSIMSDIAAGTLPAWYNALPSSVKAWATADFVGGFADASATAESSPTKTAGSSPIETGSGSQTAARETSASSTETPSSESSTEASSSQVSSTAVETTTASSTIVVSSTATPSPSSTESTGGAPAPTGAVAMGVAGAAGILALALAL
ncbi:uncharacterized protein N7515_006346 [Penicillium bovifimosum]|uniref:Uncharacterized protein n=1 Tax=Penicillium bovifimosum TaxID=126998 RepID=A0A9W9L142_9EURO|nr:uncharacterized protein N7515_006346 [Penicillium bovifimosum]KAJ5130307.1 hypothetical protein N7515_006346 [Penicillium bovifimosum]